MTKLNMGPQAEKLTRKYIYEYPSKFQQLRAFLKRRKMTVSRWFRKKREKELSKNPDEIKV